MSWLIGLTVAAISTGQAEARTDRFAYKLEMTPEEGQVDPAIGKRYTPEFARCQRRAVVTYENAACFEAEFARQDAELNQAWKITFHRVSMEQRGPLLNAQRKWIAQRDPFCDNVADEFKGGTIAPDVYSSCRVEQTIRRTIWLEALTTHSASMASPAPNDVALGLAAEQAAVAGQPKFIWKADEPSTVIAFLTWVGTIERLDIPNTLVEGLGLQSTPKVRWADTDGQRVAITTTVLDFAHVNAGSNATIYYWVYGPQRFRGEERIRRAQISLGLHDAHMCVTKAAMSSQFGAPTHVSLFTDGGGTVFTWNIGASGLWKTYAHAGFGPSETGCARHIDISQSAEANAVK